MSLALPVEHECKHLDGLLVGMCECIREVGWGGGGGTSIFEFGNEVACTISNGNFSKVSAVVNSCIMFKRRLAFKNCHLSSTNVSES